MITMLLYSHVLKELRLLKDIGFEVSCRLSEDDWDYKTYHDMDEVEALLSKHPLIDIALVDVAQPGSIRLAEDMRAQNDSLYIILLANAETSPVTYIKPTIMAAGLLLRPIDQRLVKSVFTDAVRELIRLRSDAVGGEEAFVIDNRDGKRLIPYSHISFFEARNKKIFVNTEFEEFSFYDTLDEIEGRLNSGFIRCHRSFIVSKNKIKKIMLSQGMVLLEGDYQIPLSRSYKKAFKELR